MMNFKFLFGNLCLLITFFNVGNSGEIFESFGACGALSDFIGNGGCESCSGILDCIGNGASECCSGVLNGCDNGCHGIENCIGHDCGCLGQSSNGHCHGNCCSNGPHHGHHDSCYSGGHNGNIPHHHGMSSGDGNWFFLMDPTMFVWDTPLWTNTSRNVYGYDIPEDQRENAKKDMDQAMSLYIFKEIQDNSSKQSAQIWADVRDQYNTEERLYSHFNGQDDNGQDRLQGFREFVANNAESARPATFGLRTSDSIDCLQNVNQRIVYNN